MGRQPTPENVEGLRFIQETFASGNDVMPYNMQASKRMGIPGATVARLTRRVCKELRPELYRWKGNRFGVSTYGRLDNNAFADYIQPRRKGIETQVKDLNETCEDVIAAKGMKRSLPEVLRTAVTMTGLLTDPETLFGQMGIGHVLSLHGEKIALRAVNETIDGIFGKGAAQKLLNPPAEEKEKD